MQLLLAQVPTAEAVDLIKWLLCLAALLVVAKNGRDLWVSFVPNKGAMEQYVTREELQKAISEIKRNIDDSLRLQSENYGGKLENIRDQYHSMKEALMELKSYGSRTAHDTKDALNNLSLKVERISVAMEMTAQLPLRRPTPPFPPPVEETEV